MGSVAAACKSEGEAVSGEWDDYVARSPEATVSHLYGWRRVVSEAYGHETFYLTVRRRGKVSGILPLVQVKSRLFGNVLSSMPFQDYGGIVADDMESAGALLDQALQLKKRCGAHSLELRQRTAVLAEQGKSWKDKATLILDISAGPERLWKSFSPKVRNQVRKAQKSGLHVQTGGSELLEEFYRPFAVNMRDLGSPVHHLKFFREIFAAFGERARVMLVREGKDAIGGLIALFFRDTAVVPWASCYRRYFPKCPNNLLYWEAIQHACNRECRCFDFGRSSTDSGTYRFKLQWGAAPHQLQWRIFSDGDPGESRTLRLASAVWKQIPLSLANYLGPRIRKYITN